MNDINEVFDPQAEGTVIATLMLHPEYILHTDYLKPSHFKDLQNARIYWAIGELYKDGISKIDALNISNKINSRKLKVEQLDTRVMTELQNMINFCDYTARHTLEEYKMYAKRLVVLAYKRDLYKVASEIQDCCFNNSLDLSNLNSKIQNRLGQLNQNYIVSEDIVNFGDVIDDLWDNLCNSRINGMIGLPFKSPLLTQYCQLRQGELCLVSGRMKSGKSTFCLNEACNAMKAGTPVLYIDTEMTSQSFMVRMLANLTKISTHDIECGTYNVEQAGLIKKTMEFIKSRKFVHKYMPIFNKAEILETHKILKYKGELGLSVYDYFKCNSGNAAEISAELGSQIDFYKNEIAGELYIPVLAAAQTNREGKLADSDRLERYCSTSLYWRAKTSEEIATDGGLDAGNFCLKVALNRHNISHAEDEYINFNFDGSTMSIIQSKIQKKEENPFG